MQTQNPLLFTLNIIWLDMAHCIFSIYFGNLVTLFNFSFLCMWNPIGCKHGEHIITKTTKQQQLQQHQNPTPQGPR